MLERLRAVPGVQWAQPVGSLRRGQDTVGDIEIVAATVAARRGHRRTAHRAGIAARAAPGRAAPVSAHRARAGRRAPAGAGERRRGAALPDRVGRALRGAARARRRVGLAPDGRRPARRRRHAAAVSHRRRDLRGARPAVHPAGDPRRRRRDRGGASRGELPALVSRADIRGDLHMHTLWSDGRDPIEAMVQGCVALGYEYMAITDHSPSSAAIAQPHRRRREEAGRRDCRAARAVSDDRDPARLRGRHPAGRPARFPRPDPRALRHRAGVAARRGGPVAGAAAEALRRRRCSIRS